MMSEKKRTLREKASAGTGHHMEPTLAISLGFPTARLATRRSGPGRSWRTLSTTRPALAAVVAVLLVATVSFAVRPAAAAFASRHVIVRTLPGHEHAVEREVSNLGGNVGMELPIVSGFSATIPDSAWQSIAGDSGVVEVTPNGGGTLSNTDDPPGDPD